MGEKNPSVTDQVAEVVKGLNNTEELLRSMGFATCGDRLNQDARLIATLAAEVEGRRKQPRPRHVSGECLACDIVQLTRDTDALLAEVKR